jgi:hypothetical protein
MLISLVFLSLTAFSQKDTTIDSKSFPIPIVRLIMKDLLSGDSAKAQLKLTEKQLSETENKVIMKDSIINGLRMKESNYLVMVDAEKEKYKIVSDYSKKLEKDLKLEKVKNKFNKIVGVGLVAVLTFFLITK